MAYSDGLSASDVALLTNDNNRNNSWGDGGSWWIIVFLIFAFLGWGRNGFNGNGNDGNSAANWSPCCTPATQQSLSDAMNFSQLDNAARGIQNGICDGFYSMNSSIANLGYQLLECCCETQRSIDGVNYNMAKNTCDIINANNANTQRIIDTLTQNEITALRTELQSAQLALQNNAQTQTLVNQLKPVPIPAYLTCSPYQSYSYPYGYNTTGCGYNNGGCCA